MVIICYSLSDPLSYENVYTKWYPEVKCFCPNIPILLVGTKNDIRSDKEAILNMKEMHRIGPMTVSEGIEMCEEIGAYKYVECSSRTQDGVKLVFDEAVSAVLSSKKRIVTNEPRGPFPLCCGIK